MARAAAGWVIGQRTATPKFLADRISRAGSRARTLWSARGPKHARKEGRPGARPKRFADLVISAKPAPVRA